MNFLNKKVNSRTRSLNQLQQQHQSQQSQQSQIHQRQPSPQKTQQQSMQTSQSMSLKSSLSPISSPQSVMQQQQQQVHSPQSNRNMSLDPAKLIDSTLQTMNNASNLRNNLTEKRLLVKLLKATNLASLFF